LLVIQIDGLRVGDHVLVAAIGIDGAGDKHVLAVALGVTENAAVVKALLADLVERGCDRISPACSSSMAPRR
jgi:transposase-like protein